MEQYYSKEDIDKYGVIGIELEVVNKNHNLFYNNIE